MNETDDVFHKTGILVASQMGSDKCIELLIKAGADVDKPDILEETVLMTAAWAGQEKCVELLLKGGTDVNMVDNSEETALAKAAAKSQVNCVIDFNKGGMTPLMKVTFNGNIECECFWRSYGGAMLPITAVMKLLNYY